MSLVAKTIAYVIVGAALTVSPHAPVSTNVAPRAEAATPADAPQIDKEKVWAEADLVCEIEGDVWAVDIDAEEPEKVLLIKDATNPSVRPGSKDIAFVRGVDVWLWSATDRSEIKLAEGALGSSSPDRKPRLLGRLAWHPGGRWLAVSTWQRVTWQAHPSVERARPFYESPDGQGPDEFWFQSLRLLDTENGKSYELVGTDIDTEWGVMLGAHAPAWSSDGKRLVYIRGGDIWELDGIEPARLWVPWEPYVGWKNRRIHAAARLSYAQAGSPRSVGAIEVCYTPDGGAVIYCLHRLRGSDDTKAFIVAVPRLDGEGPPPMDPWLTAIVGRMEGFFHSVTISTDGKRVAYVKHGAIWVCEQPSTEPRKIVEDGWCPSWMQKE